MDQTTTTTQTTQASDNQQGVPSQTQQVTTQQQQSQPGFVPPTTETQQTTQTTTQSQSQVSATDTSQNKEQSLTDGLKQPAVQAYQHQATGNAAFDMAMVEFGGKGLNPEGPEFLAASKGDFGPLEEFAKKAGVSQQFLDLAKQAYEQINSHYQQVHGETIKTVMDMAGGQDVWEKEVIPWVKQNADPAELKEIVAELEAGGRRSVNQARDLIERYKHFGAKQPNTKPADPFNTGSQTTTVSGGPLSPHEYQAEYVKLVEKIGFSGLEKSSEYKALQQRRLAWRG